MDCQVPRRSSSIQIAPSCKIYIRGELHRRLSEIIMEPKNVANAQSEINEKYNVF